MKARIKVLGVPFDVVTMKESVDKILGFFEDQEHHMVCTANPEIVMIAQEDEQYMQILQESDLVVADGIGVVWASNYAETQLPERVAGYDLCQNLFQELAKTDYKIYFLGSSEQVVKEAAIQMEKQHKGLCIVGTRDGYFQCQDEKEIVQSMKDSGCDLILVGLGMPRQEKWIYENLKHTGAKVAIGVGGSFDVMSGKVKRAPKIIQKMKLEWFYRLLCQPTRFYRQLQLPRFVIEVLRKMR